MIAQPQITKARVLTEQKSSENSHEFLLQFRSFSASFALLLSAILSAFLIQHLGPELQKPFAFRAWATLLILGFWIAAAVPLRRQLFWILTSYQFAVSILTTSAIAVMLGTFIIQNASPEEYLQMYGRPVTALIHTFFLNDAFHSFWFGSLMVMIGISLFFVLLKRNPFRLTQLGFLFSHGGIILILVGAWTGSFRGQTGMIHLNEGMSATSMNVVKNNVYTGEEQDLGFTVRLEDFQVDYYQGDYKIYAYRLDPKSREYRAIGSYPMKEGSFHRIPGSDTSFRIDSVTGTDLAEARLKIDGPAGATQAMITNKVEDSVYLNEGQLVLALDRREKEAREYRSLVSIWENGQEKRREVIQVNRPLKYKGVALYQSNYDPENPTYSGLEVVRDPGLGFVYAGFLMICLGVVFIFYIRPRVVDAARRKQEVEHAA